MNERKCSNLFLIVYKLVWNKIKKNLLKLLASISDAVEAGQNGFKNVFKDDYNQIMC